jgi:transposase
MTLRVLEFKVQLDSDREQKVESWLFGLRKFWNYVLNEMFLLDEFSWWNKSDKQRYLCCPLPWTVWIEKSGESAPRSDIVSPSSRRIIRQFGEIRAVTPKSGETGLDVLARSKAQIVPSSAPLTKVWGWKSPEDGLTGYSCPIPRSPEPLIRSFKAKNSKTGLALLNKSDTILTTDRLDEPTRQAILNVPYTYRKALLMRLDKAWEEYSKSRSGASKIGRGRPKFKSLRFPLTSLSDSNPKGATIEKDSVLAIGDYLKVPGLSNRQIAGMKLSDCYIHIKGLSKRWRNPDGSIPRVCVFTLLKKRGGWFVQLTGDVERSAKLYKRPRGFIGIDTGIKENNWLSSDRGAYSKPLWDRLSMDREVALQREIDRKLSDRLILWLAHPKRTVSDIKTLVPGCSIEGAEQLLQVRSFEQLCALQADGLVSGGVVGRLKYNAVPLSNRVKILKERLNKLKSCNADRRRALQHKTSTFIVRRYGCIAIEDGIQDLKARKAAKVSLDEQRFEKNGQRMQRGMNLSLSDAAHGQLIDFLGNKAKDAGRPFFRVKQSQEISPTQDCPCCGTRNPQQQDIGATPDFRCSHCGYYCRDRDLKAAVYLAVRAFDEGLIKWDALSKPARVALRYRDRIPQPRQV